MQLKELNMRPEEDGRVIIPAEVLEAIGTNADGTVYVTYLAEEDSGGPEVFVSPLEVGELTPDRLYEDGTHLTVPEELLEEAGIQPDEDLEVVCEDRRITILPAGPRLSYRMKYWNCVRKLESTLRRYGSLWKWRD